MISVASCGTGHQELIFVTVIGSHLDDPGG